MTRKCNNNECEHCNDTEEWGCKHPRFKEQMDNGAGVSCGKFTRAHNYWDRINYYIPAWRSR